MGHINRNSNLVTRLSILRNRNSNLTGILINRHTIRSTLTRSELSILRHLGVVTVLVLNGRSRNRHILTRLTRTIPILRLELIRILDSDSHINSVRRTIRIRHNNRNSNLVTRLSTLQNLNADGTILVNGHTLRRTITRGKLRTLRSSGRVTVLVRELRSINLGVLARLTRTILIPRRKRLIILHNGRVSQE